MIAIQASPRRICRMAHIGLVAATLLVAGGLLQTASAADPAAHDDLRINQLQYVGTHNSYHLRDPKRKQQIRGSDYSHAPLDVQLDRGVRSFELDLHYRDGQFEVFHVPLVDEVSSCPTLDDALATIRAWSEEHPRHVPISFLFELKREGPRIDKRIKAVDAAALDQLDAQLRAGLGKGQIITPDDVRGTASTLRDAVTSSGWPTLADARGKVLFVLHDNRQTRDLYTDGRPSLSGRVMFVRSDPARDDAATLVLDNPTDPDIPRLAKEGYFIRTRADSGLRADPPQQPARRAAAMGSGAHILSTDFPTGEADADTGYVVQFDGAAPARVNPVNGPADVAGQTVTE